MKRVMYVLFYVMAISAAQSHGIDLVLFSSEKEISRSEPFVVTIRLSNHSIEHFKFLGKRHLKVHVATPDGTELEFDGLPPRGGLQPYTGIELEPGEHELYNVVLSEWYMFSDIGEYAIAVAVAENPFRGPYRQSNAIALRVSPYDPERLEKRASTFYSGAMTPSSFWIGRQNAEALSLIIDPLSVPMLEKVLQEGDRLYRSIIADGLVRQGSLEAVDVLTRNLGRFGDGEEGQVFDELLYRSLRQIAYPDISPWLLVRSPPDQEARNRAKKIVDRTNRGFMILD